MDNAVDSDHAFCEQHSELADLLVEHGCAPAGEDRELLRALVRREAVRVVCEQCGEISAETQPFRALVRLIASNKCPRCTRQ